MLIFTFSIRLAALVYRCFQTYAPSNILIRHLRSPDARRWTLPIALASAVAYLLATRGFTLAIENGAPGWLNLLVFYCAWNAIRFALIAATAMLSQPVRLARRLLAPRARCGLVRP